MQELLNNFELSKTLSKNAYNLVNNTYIAEKVANKLNNIIQTITKKRNQVKRAPRNAIAIHCIMFSYTLKEEEEG